MRKFLLTVIILLTPSVSVASGKNLKGWDYLYQKLLQNGVHESTAKELLTSRRMPHFTPVYFKPSPAEPLSMYRKHNTSVNRENAVAFYKEYASAFRQAALKYHVPESVILSIIQIESQCGRYTGNSRVFYRLARLVSTADPDNIVENYKFQKKRDPNVTLVEVRNRARVLEDTFLPHLIATIDVAERMNTEPLEVRGSVAGALGLPQFLPGNIDLYGVDGNGDGVIDLFEPLDAIPSVARFLHQNGWGPETTSIQEMEEIIWHYNRSKSYIHTVLSMSQKLSRPLQSYSMKKKATPGASSLLATISR